MKLTKARVAQIIKEEYQRIQEDKEDNGYNYSMEPLKKLRSDLSVAIATALKAKSDPAAIYRLVAAEVERLERNNPGMKNLKEEEQTVGAGIEDISADDVLGNQPGLGFDLGSQEAFRLLYTQYDGGRNKAQIGKDFEKIAQIDPKLSDVFKALILSNPILFPDETEGSVDLMRNDPEAVDAALAAIPDELEELEEDMDSLVKNIQNLMKDPRSTS